MNEELLSILRKSQFERVKGELRSLVSLFDFPVTDDMIIKFEHEIKEKGKIKRELEDRIELFISYIEENFMSRMPDVKDEDLICIQGDRKCTGIFDKSKLEFCDKDIVKAWSEEFEKSPEIGVFT